MNCFVVVDYNDALLARCREYLAVSWSSLTHNRGLSGARNTALRRHVDQ